MNELRDKLGASTRQRLLQFIAEGIHALTIMARDPDMSGIRKAQINNSIHYLSGRMMRLLDPEVTCSDHDLDDVVAQVAELNPTLYRGMVSRLEAL